MRTILTVFSSIYRVAGGPTAERVELPIFKVILLVEEFGLAVCKVELPLAECAVLIPQLLLRGGHFLMEVACFLLKECITVREFRDALLEHLLGLHGSAICRLPCVCRSD